jgi:hypothetical protein
VDAYSYIIGGLPYGKVAITGGMGGNDVGSAVIHGLLA